MLLVTIIVLAIALVVVSYIAYDYRNQLMDANVKYHSIKDFADNAAKEIMKMDKKAEQLANKVSELVAAAEVKATKVSQAVKQAEAKVEEVVKEVATKTAGRRRGRRPKNNK